MRGSVRFYLMSRNRVERKDHRWQVAAAVACFVIAVVGGIAGWLLTTGWVLNSQAHPALYAIGLTLLIIALPLLVLGGHCLDLLDRKRQSAANHTYNV